MQAVIPDGSFAAWGWGASMFGTEIVMFSGNGESSDVQYFFSEGQTDPTPQQATYSPCYEWTLDDFVDSTVYLTATRPLECTDPSNAYVV